MKSNLFGRYVCGPVMVLAGFFCDLGGSAADKLTEKRTKQFLTSGQVDLAREVVRLPLHRGRLDDALHAETAAKRSTAFLR